jgi:hypothetical protein
MCKYQSCLNPILRHLSSRFIPYFFFPAFPYHCIVSQPRLDPTCRWPVRSPISRSRSLIAIPSLIENDWRVRTERTISLMIFSSNIPIRLPLPPAPPPVLRRHQRNLQGKNRRQRRRRVARVKWIMNTKAKKANRSLWCIMCHGYCLYIFVRDLFVSATCSRLSVCMHVVRRIRGLTHLRERPFPFPSYFSSSSSASSSASS